MCSRFPDLRPVLLAAACLPLSAQAATLRVCADPDNMPYSHRDLGGFENRIAALVAEDLHAALEHFWQEQGRGFVRKSAGECDLFIGVPAGFDKLLTTRPYYRSTYVALAPVAKPARDSFEPAWLATRKIGLQLIGNDLVASPPGYALVRAGTVGNVTGYPLYGQGPAAQRMVQALERGEIDLALVWGPQAGWFAQRSSMPLRVLALHAPEGTPAPFEFSIAMGVRKGDTALRDAVDGVLVRRRADIDAILAQYAVPRVGTTGGQP